MNVRSEPEKFYVGDRVWCGPLGQRLVFEITGPAEPMGPCDSIYPPETLCHPVVVVESPYKRPYAHVAGYTMRAPALMLRLVERSVTALDWMNKDQWNLGRLDTK